MFTSIIHYQYKTSNQSVNRNFIFRIRAKKPPPPPPPPVAGEISKCRRIKTVKQIEVQSFLVGGFYGYPKYLK